MSKKFIYIDVTPKIGSLLGDLLPVEQFAAKADEEARLALAAPALLELAKNAIFALESVAHLRGLEASILPTTHEMRAFLKSLNLAQ